MGNDSGEPAPPLDAELRHNIRGPLTSIILTCELLMEGDCPPAVRQRVQTILSEAMQISRHLRGDRQSG